MANSNIYTIALNRLKRIKVQYSDPLYTNFFATPPIEMGKVQGPQRDSPSWLKQVCMYNLSRYP
jgi:hypothetical protein